VISPTCAQAFCCLIYVAVSDSVMRHSTSSRSQVLFANSDALPDGRIVPFMMGGWITPVVLDTTVNLFVGDHACEGTIGYSGRL
jgi:hypothetical protein